MAILSVPITLDKQRNLRYGFKSMELLEDLFPGKGFLEVMDDFRSNPKMKTLRKIMYAGLVHEDPELTPEKVGDIIDGLTLGELMEKLLEASEGALTEKNSEPAGEVAEKPTAE
jgi:hypothetical protein